MSNMYAYAQHQLSLFPFLTLTHTQAMFPPTAVGGGAVKWHACKLLSEL